MQSISSSSCRVLLCFSRHWQHSNTFLNSIIQRFDYVDRISTVIDDYTHRSKSLSVAGWGCPRVNVNMAELRSMGNGGLSQRLRRDPLPHLRALEAACHEISMEARPGYDKNGTKRYSETKRILFLCLPVCLFDFFFLVLTKRFEFSIAMIHRHQNQSRLFWSRWGKANEPSQPYLCIPATAS